ncbi:helix-turn-helix domain-containing protein [Nonomuraea sp. NBC_00507]|uniref:helix-turn-helix domain-containing protein n=1 Tax=Nonomuraea sp. NBC_00507 TaxID=2976002 RepID=UPI002E173CBC
MTEIFDSDSLQSGPTALRLLIGAQLRRLRESSGITREDAGYAIRGSHSKISRMESGRTSFKRRDVADLLTLYGVSDDAERASLLALVAQANAPSWWSDYRDVIPDWFEPYLGLEHDAALIRTHEVQFVPGLLQTEDYARAVIAQGHEHDSPQQIERRVALRMRRQEILNPPTPRKLWVVLDEGALRRRVGGEAIMRAQLEHLARMAGQPHITLQIVPFASGSTIGGVGPVTMLRFTQQGLNDVVYLEHLTGAQYLTKESDVRHYRRLLDELGVHASPPAGTPALLDQIIEKL